MEFRPNLIPPQKNIKNLFSQISPHPKNLPHNVPTSVARMFRETSKALEAGGLPQTCGQTSGLPCQSKPGGTRFPRRERPLKGFRKVRGETARSYTACHAQAGFRKIRSGQDMERNERNARGHASAEANELHYTRDISAFACVLRVEVDAKHGRMAQRERRSLGISGPGFLTGRIGRWNTERYGSNPHPEVPRRGLEGRGLRAECVAGCFEALPFGQSASA